MRWASTVSLEPVLDTAVAESATTVRRQLNNDAPELIVVFVSQHHGGGFDRVADLVRAQLSSGVLIGCSAGSVIGGGKEVEQRPGLSLTAAVLPGVEVTAFHLDVGDLHAGSQGLDLQQRLGASPDKEPHFVLLADPFSFDPESFLPELDRTYPGSGKIGGLASGGQHPGANALYLGPQVHRSGLVGVALSGNIEVDTIVAQGCRPIGQPMFVTKSQGNVIWELDGRRAIEVLEALFEGLSPADQELAHSSLFLGIAMNEDRQEYRQGDFLIRNLVGMDPARGAIAVGAVLHGNEIVQFHLRDARTSAHDLEQLLMHYRADRHGATPAGGLLFSCLGRGMNLYGRPDHDTGAVRQHLGDIPLGGFFCNGEIGPVHGATFLHGYTSAFGLFRSRRA
jgi:small ligand-binding sensory domain FIST